MSSVKPSLKVVSRRRTLTSKENPTHYDKLGRIINVGATVLAAVDFDTLSRLKVISLHPVMIRVGKGGKLVHPDSVVVLTNDL